MPLTDQPVQGEVAQPAEGSVPIALGWARSAWPLSLTEAEPSADRWADLLLAVALLFAVLWAGLRPQGVARSLLADVFKRALPALGTG